MGVHEFVRAWILPFGDPRRIALLARLPAFFAQLHAYRKRATGERVSLRDTYPCLADASDQTPFDPHYLFQGAWLARQLAAARPPLHVDVGSSVITMSTVSAIVPTVFVDYRPLRARIPGLQCVAGDLLRLPFADGSVLSLSCLHVIEHIGLGRYGDPLDPDGPAKAARELARVVTPGGSLYLSTPVGRSRVCFNAHRVFAPEAVAQLFPDMSLSGFAFVDDSGGLHERSFPANAAANEYACGMFVLRKPSG